MMDSARYNFGEFQLDVGAFELQRSGERVPLERIPMELLILLVCRKRELVTREEIAEKLWGSEIFIDTNTAINVAVRKVRQALDDTVESPRYILTIPAKGYRFIGSISGSLPQSPDVTPASQSSLEVSADSIGSAPVSIEASDQLVATATQPAKAGSEQMPDVIRRLPLSGRWLILIFVLGAIGLALVAVLGTRNHSNANKVMFVVLPFENLTGDPNQEYIADGMTEEMITQLGGLDPEHLGVIARTSAMRFKGTQKSAAEIARELGVSYLLEGSVRHVGDRMRITAQLIQASDETHLWASDYDSDLSNLLQLESDIAAVVASQVRVKLMPNERTKYNHTVKPEAQAAYLRGLEDWNLRTGSSIADAISEFNRAVAADPSYALPFAALARCYVLGPVFGLGNPLETMPKAREFAAHALELDPNLAEAHSMLAMVAAHYDYDWPTAEDEFLAALRLNPSDPYAHLFYSNSFLSPHGRHKEAIEEMQKAIALDPLSIPLQAFLIRTYTWARRYDDARSQFEKTNEVAPNFAVLHERAAHLFVCTGDFKQAIEEDARARLLSGEQADQVIAEKAMQLNALTQGGARSYWQMQLDLSRKKPHPPEAYVTPFGLAVVYAHLGTKDSAFGALEQAFNRRDVQLTEARVEPAFDGLRSDPRFHELLSRIHLVDGAQ
jgi:TolB-like protein/DNA-binding winged helix-turn-helix (wHTH) protein/Tfp pilus assembly protein PilF